MNADLLKSIIGLGIALIPLIIVIVRAFLTRTARTTGTLESSRLKALEIKRLAFDKNEFDILYRILRNFYLKVFVTLAFIIALVELLISALSAFLANHLCFLLVCLYFILYFYCLQSHYSFYSSIGMLELKGPAQFMIYLKALI